MIAVELVIRKLMGEYEFVIIPGFGALLSHQVPATFDTYSGIFSPPVKKLAFNEYLKLDDGLLANSISREENLSHLEAVDYVKNYTEQLKNELELTGQVEIPGIGLFNKNVEGKLVFEPNTDKHFKDEWYGFEKIKVNQVLNAAPAAPNQAPAAEQVVEVVELEETNVQPVRWTRWAAAAVIAGLLCGLSFFVINTPVNDIQSTLNPFTELFRSEEPAVATSKKSVHAPQPIAPAPVAIAVDSLADSTATDSVAAVAVMEEKAPAVVEPIDNNIAEAKFQVIAGTFKGAKQAGILLSQLKAKGLENAVIIPPDRTSKKVKVAVNGFDNEKEAYLAAAALKEVTGEVGWVYKRK